VTTKHYKWSVGGRPAELERHSEAKHELLRAYLTKYLRTLVATPRQDVVRATIVDGFAGGGLYVRCGTSEILPGSPLICLEAVTEAKALIELEQQRRKPIALDVDFFFVDSDPSAVAFLIDVLQERGHRPNEDGSRVRILQGDFKDHAAKIIAFIAQKSARVGRSIFILDQYGYSEVPATLLRRITATLPRSEIILTFNVDSFLTYASEENRRRFLEKTGIDPFAGRSLEEIRAARDWRLFIQRTCIGDLQADANAQFFTPFFLRPERGHGDIWLVHLSQHVKARDVMTEVHWAGKNFVHPGGSGLDMLGFSARVARTDAGLLEAPEIEFDAIARERTLAALMQEIPEQLSPIAIRFGDFFARHCNGTPATREIMAQAVFSLAREGDVELRTPAGHGRRQASAIDDADTVKLSHQTRFFFSKD
jgi:three-Cys-motif partner protein